MLHKPRCHAIRFSVSAVVLTGLAPKNNTAVFLANVTVFLAAAPLTGHNQPSVRLFYIDALGCACQLAALPLCALALLSVPSSMYWCSSRGWPAMGIYSLVPRQTAPPGAAVQSAAAAAAPAGAPLCFSPGTPPQESRSLSRRTGTASPLLHLLASLPPPRP